MQLPAHQRDLVLAVSLAGSLVLHGMMLYLWQLAPAGVSASAEPRLAIQLVRRETPTAQPPVAVSENAPRPAARPRRAATTAPAPVPTAVVAQEIAASAVEVPEQVMSAPVATTSERRAELVRAVQQRLTDYFSYPLLARRKGWEGEVLLGFSVDADGWLHSVHVARSSGYPLLDRSALESLLQVQRLRDAPLDTFELQIPVIYRLREG